MSMVPLGWEQTAQAAPTESTPVREAAPVPESQLTSNAQGVGMDGQPGDFSSLRNPTSLPGLQIPAERKPQTRGFLHIVRHGAGPRAIYVVTFRRIDSVGANPQPVLAEGSGMLIELLERLGVDFKLNEVREAMTDILRLGSANIPDLWLSDEEMLEKGLVES
jgi:hypothetical protein